MNTHQWEGHELKVFAESQANYLFCFVGLSIVIDDKHFLCSPRPALQDLIPFRFEHNGREVRGFLKTRGINTAFRVNYELMIGDVVVGRFHVRAGNWWLAYPSLLILGVGLGLGVVKLLGILGL